MLQTNKRAKLFKTTLQYRNRLTTFQLLQGLVVQGRCVRDNPMVVIVRGNVVAKNRCWRARHDTTHGRTHRNGRADGVDVMVDPVDVVCWRRVDSGHQVLQAEGRVGEGLHTFHHSLHSENEKLMGVVYYNSPSMRWGFWLRDESPNVLCSVRSWKLLPSFKQWNWNQFNKFW